MWWLATRLVCGGNGKVMGSNPGKLCKTQALIRPKHRWRCKPALSCLGLPLRGGSPLLNLGGPPLLSFALEWFDCSGITVGRAGGLFSTPRGCSLEPFCFSACPRGRLNSLGLQWLHNFRIVQNCRDLWKFLGHTSRLEMSRPPSGSGGTLKLDLGNQGLGGQGQ